MKKKRINTDLDSLKTTLYGERFLTGQALALIEFSKGAFVESGGYGYLDSLGKVDPSKNQEVYIQCRMIQVFGLAHLFGLSETKNFVEHGVNALLDLFLDKENGGFFNAIDSDGKPCGQEKLAYDHMFVLLAASTAKTVSAPRAEELLQIIDRIIDDHFWDDEFRMMNNSWDLGFKNLDNYRGINANMHAVEALCAAYDMTGNLKYRDRAYAISKRTVDVFARKNRWLLPEHFDERWNFEPDFNLENPADPFRPYGVTIGHLFEWSRLILQLKTQMKDSIDDLNWIDQGAANLYEVGRKYGWAPDGTDGFVYTLDWQTKPVVRSRMFWVAAEAVMTAYSLWRHTGESQYFRDYDDWWRYIDENVLDKTYGSWFHELDPNQNVVSHTWSGKPDTYHALNACLLAMYPLGSSFLGTAVEAPTNGTN